MKTVFKTFGTDFQKRNGDDSYELPIPATILVDGKGVVRNTYVEPEYQKRLEIATALEWVNAL